MMYFNPRTPVGCDRPSHVIRPFQGNFNPRTPVGCDDCANSSISVCMSFQSTHPSGVRRHVQRAVGEQLVISIHAPQWGATGAKPGERDTRVYFNPRTPVGCDPWFHQMGPYQDISIHAPQWGATPRGCRSAAPSAHFNPRTPVGCDSSRLAGDAYRSNFNPRTPVGCDLPPHLGHGLIL